MSFNVTEIQPELLEKLPIYDRIEDCIDGSDAIKEKGREYLPMPDPTNDSEENTARYADYLDRAIFISVLQRTVSALAGMVMKNARIDTIDYLKNDIDGSGVQIEQQMKKVAAKVISIGRSGLLVDYTSTDEEATQEQILSGNVRPYITRYDARNIIWQEDDLIILRETYQDPTTDGYKTETKIQYKVLVMQEGVYTQEIWRNSQSWYLYSSKIPKQSSGSSFDYMPFTFVGSENNDRTFDTPPATTIADLNIGMYRNSADYEESLFVIGQPTIAVSGLTQTWLEGVLGGTVRMGSLGGLPLPEGADAKILQAQQNTMAMEGMLHKERQMIAMGAQLVTTGGREKTATETNKESLSSDSSLATISNNIEQAYRFCFEVVNAFIGVKSEIELNKDFNISDYDAQTATSLTNDFMQGAGRLEDIFKYKQDNGMIAQDVNYNDWKEGLNEI